MALLYDRNHVTQVTKLHPSIIPHLAFTSPACEWHQKVLLDERISRTHHDGMQRTKSVILTGATSGIGREAARAIAKNPNWHLVITGRDPSKLAETAENLRAIGGSVSPLAIDLASLSSVRAAVAELVQRTDVPPLQGIICNAGVQEMGPPTRTNDGFDATFGVNHLATFLLVQELLPALRSPTRIVIVSSGTHDPATREGRFNPPATIDVDDLSSVTGAARLSGIRRYTTSKLCNVLFAYELDRRLRARGKEASVIAFDPGAVPGTELTRHWGPCTRAMATNRSLLRMLGVTTSTPKEAGEALARIALESPPAEAARYFTLERERRSSVDSYDPILAARLWDETERLLNQRS